MRFRTSLSIRRLDSGPGVRDRPVLGCRTSSSNTHCVLITSSGNRHAIVQTLQVLDSIAVCPRTLPRNYPRIARELPNSDEFRTGRASPEGVDHRSRCDCVSRQARDAMMHAIRAFVYSVSYTN